MKSSGYNLWILVLLGAFVLSACRQTAEVVPTVSVTRTDIVSPLSSPTAPEPTAVEAPTTVPLTPDPGTGLVHGVLLRTGQPLAAETVYLAPVIATEGDFKVSALDPTSDPRTVTDAAGNFVFAGLEPGQYAFGLVSPGGLVLIQGSDGKEILVQVEADEVVDMGTVVAPVFE